MMTMTIIMVSIIIFIYLHEFLTVLGGALSILIGKSFSHAQYIEFGRYIVLFYNNILYYNVLLSFCYKNIRAHESRPRKYMRVHVRARAFNPQKSQYPPHCTLQYIYTARMRFIPRQYYYIRYNNIYYIFIYHGLERYRYLVVPVSVCWSTYYMI